MTAARGPAHQGEPADEVPPTPRQRVPRLAEQDIPEAPEEDIPELPGDDVVDQPAEPPIPPAETRSTRDGADSDT